MSRGTLLLLAFLVGSLLLANPIRPAHATPTPALYVLPAEHANLPSGSITYMINFTNFPAFNGIDIQVEVSGGVLSPSSIVFSSSTWGFLLTNCINGAGTGCGATDAPGIAHFSALDTAGFLVGSGNMFNVTFSVQAATGSTPVNIVRDTVSDTAGNPIDHNDFNAVYGPDFSVSPGSPAAVDATQSATSTITVGVVNGPFAGTVSLTDSVPTGLTCGSISPSSTSVPGVATVSCSSTSAGNFVVTFNGTSGPITHLANATFTFVDFTVSASSPAPVNVGSSSTSTITVTGLNGFAGTVTLSDTPPSGLTCGSITPTTVTGSGTATVSCSSTTSGAFSLPISGTDGTVTHSTTATFTFGVDFTLTASSPSLVDAGQSSSSTITVTGGSGFTATVSLSDTPLPSSLSCQPINPSSIMGTGTATLSCTATTPGNYVVTISGTSMSPTITHTATATFSFRDFSITSSSPSGAVGASISSTITVSAQNGFASTVSLADTPLPSGLTCSGGIMPPTVSTSGTAMLSCTSLVAGDYLVTVTGTSGTLMHNAIATFKFFDFTVAASSPAIDVGHSGDTVVTVGTLNGFSGTVTLSDTPSSGLACGSFSPGSVSGSGTATLSCSASAVGSYDVTVMGTSGSLTHVVTATFQFVDFTVGASSPSVDITRSASSTITVAALNGFAATVTFSDFPDPSLTCSAISPASISGSGTTSLSCRASAIGSYAVIVSATDGTLHHNASLTMTFAPSVAVSGVTVSAPSVSVGGKVVVNATLTNNGAVSKEFTILAKWGAVTVAQENVTLAPGASQTVSLSWDTSQYAPGTGNIVVDVPQEGVQQTGPQLTLAAAPQSPLSGNTLLLIIAAVIAAIIVASILLIMRMRGAKGRSKLEG